MTVRWTEDQYKQFVNQKEPVKAPFVTSTVESGNKDLKSIMSYLIEENVDGMKNKKINDLLKKPKSSKCLEDNNIFNEVNKKLKRKNAVLDAIKNTTPEIVISEDKCLIWWENLRLYTLNEILALLQVQPYLIFSYKKMLNKKIKDAMLIGYPQIAYSNKKEPWFKFPVIIELFRSHKKLFDNDGFPAAFKYLTDSLKSDGVNLIREDDPMIVVGYKIHQSTSAGTSAGVLVRRATDEEVESQKERDVKKEWFDLFKN